MADQKIILTSTNTGGQTLQKTLTNINPDAGNTELKTFAQMLNNMTYNTYGRTDRVIKYNCDTESGGGGKLTPTFTLGKTTDTAANVKASIVNGALAYGIDFTYDGDGLLSASCTDGNLGATVIDNESMHRFVVCSFLPGANVIVEPSTFTFTAAETDNYKAATVTFTITA